MPSQDVLNIHSEYLKLRNRQKIDSILKENNDDPAIIEIIDLLSKNEININDITSQNGLRKDFDTLKLQYNKLDVECFCTKESADYWKLEFYRINKKFYSKKINYISIF